MSNALISMTLQRLYIGRPADWEQGVMSMIASRHQDALRLGNNN